MAVKQEGGIILSAPLSGPVTKNTIKCQIGGELGFGPIALAITRWRHLPVEASGEETAVVMEILGRN